jgi:Leucine Rich repeat
MAGFIARRSCRLIPARTRSLLACVVVVACLLGGAIHLIRGARLRRRAVAAVARAGGYAHYEWEDRATGASSRWLLNTVGAEYLGEIKRVFLAPLDADSLDSAMARVGALRGLEELTLRGNAATDGTLSYLRGSVMLRDLFVDSDRVGDKGLAYLAALPRLRDLRLSGTGITDGGMESISTLKDLETLDVSRTAITDAGLDRIASLRHLKVLKLAFTKIDDDGVARLADLRELRSVDLRATGVTEVAARRLRRSLPNAMVQQGPWVEGSEVGNRPRF